MKNLILLIAITIVFSACTKEAGEGGTSIIHGQVYKIHTFQNSITGEIDTLYFQLDAGKDVFIIYSDDETAIYDDEFETDYNGRYRFEFLRKGDYTIYTYADSTVGIPPFDVKYDYPVFLHIEIKENNFTNNIDDFVIEKNQ